MTNKEVASLIPGDKIICNGQVLIVNGIHMGIFFIDGEKPELFYNLSTNEGPISAEKAEKYNGWSYERDY
jgi:hypothetical protein